MAEKNWYLSYSSLTNAHLKELSLLIRRHSEAGFNSLSNPEKKRFDEIIHMVAEFLALVCRHHTPDALQAGWAISEAISALVELAGWQRDLSPVRRLIRKTCRAIIFRRNTGRSWLFRQAKAQVRAASTQNPTGLQANLLIFRLPDMSLSDPLLSKLKNLGCELGTARIRKKLVAEGHCHRGCDLIFMKEYLGFTQQETAYALNGIGRSTVSVLRDACERKYEALKMGPLGPSQSSKP